MDGESAPSWPRRAGRGIDKVASPREWPRLGGFPPSPGPGAHQVALAIREGAIAIRLTRAGGVLRRVNQMFEIATVTQRARHMPPPHPCTFDRRGSAARSFGRNGICKKADNLTIWKKRGNDPSLGAPQMEIKNRNTDR